METTQISYTQKVSDVATFLKERNAKLAELNSESAVLLKKFNEEVKNHKEAILFLVPFSETFVTFGVQQMSNFYNGIDYPKGGLFLREVHFVHVENVVLSELQYSTDIRVKFIFNEEAFNCDLSLDRLAFNDEHMKVSEQVVGLGVNPRFATKEKYEEVRDSLMEIVKKIRKEQKK